MKKLIRFSGLLLILMMMPSITSASVVRDNGSAYVNCVSGTSCTYQYTVGSIENSLLVCSSSNFADNDPGLTTMTYNGVSMTQLGSNQSGPYSSHMQTFYLAGAATGQHSLVITATNWQSNGFYAHCVSYGGVNQSNPIEAYQQQVDSNVSVNTDIPTTVTTLTNGAWVGSMSTDARSRAVVAGANTTKLAGCSDAQTDCFDTNGAVTPAGSRTMNLRFTNSTNDDFLTTTYVIKPDY